MPEITASQADSYSVLHRQIISGELSPGEHLVEEELAKRLGSTRGAVRAALIQLGHEGLVQRERNRGARVRRVSVAEAVEVLEARSALESLAAGYAAVRRSDAEAQELDRLVTEMERLHATGELLAMSERNATLHHRVLEISGHDVARDICTRLHSQVIRFQFRTVLAPGRSSKSLSEHRAIVEAIASRNGRRAESAMRQHLRGVADTLKRVGDRPV